MLGLEITGPTLQHCIYSWHTQAHVHAHREAPLLLFVQLRRFHYSESDSRAVKLRTDVRTQVDEVVRLPCYLNSAESSTYMQKYQVVGFVYHIGDSLKARHYKAALRCFEQSRCGSLLEVLPN